MFLCSLIEELCTKEENDNTDCSFNFGHGCILDSFSFCFYVFNFQNNISVCKAISKNSSMGDLSANNDSFKKCIS